MNEIARIPIPRETSAELEMLHYETDGWRDLILAAERINTEDKQYERVARDYIASTEALRLIMEETRKIYIPVEYQASVYRFVVDYNDCELIIMGANCNA